MNLFIEDEEIEEIKIEDLFKSKDKGVVIKNRQGESRGEEIPDLQKEIIAHDTLESSGKSAALVHGNTDQSANGYARGENLPEDARNRVLAHKHDIADLAISKLMDSLNLFDPNALDKQIDIVKSASMLAGVVEKISGKTDSKGNQVTLNLYMPKQKSLESYNVIEVR